MNKIFAILTIFIAYCGSASGKEQIYKGSYVWGHEVHSFKPCNDKNDYWVSFDWAGIEMHENYKKSITKPYQLMYLEFRGQILDEVVDGFAEEYAGLIRISEVKNYSFEVPSSCK
jgi:hypothetical protein